MKPKPSPKPSPKPDTRPRCPCGSLLVAQDISNDERGRRICWSCRSLAADSPSPEAQRVMDAMARETDYSAQVRAAMVARGLVKPEKRQRKPRAARQEALV